MKRGTIIFVIFLFLTIFAGFAGYNLYTLVYGPVVNVSSSNQYLFIPSNADFKTVSQRLYQRGFIKDTAGFNRVARWMKYPSHIYPGKYRLKEGLSNRALVKKLRSGDKAFVDLTISAFKTIPQLAGYVGGRLEADSANVTSLMRDSVFLDSLGFDKPNRFTLFITDTYEFEWNTSARAFLKQMNAHYEQFWTLQRKAKANKRNLEPQEAMTLASIIQSESNYVAEWDTIAGVYLNRLNRANMPLQADPTIQYILRKKGEKDIRRIYNKDLKVESPYNTYKYPGLPPGPICIPQKRAVEAVLNRANHQYLYFVANTGKRPGHRFSRTLRQHNRLAREYQRHLNQESIY